MDRSGLNQHALNHHGEEPLRLTPANMAPRQSGRPKKHDEGIEVMETPVLVRKKTKPVVQTLIVETDEAGDIVEETAEMAEMGLGGLGDVKTEVVGEAAEEEEEAVPGTKTGRVKKAATSRSPAKGRKRRRREDEQDNPRKALWKAGLAPHPGGRPPKHRANVVVLPAPVSIVRTGRKRMPQALVEDLELLPPKKERCRGRGRPKKAEQLAMLEAGSRGMQELAQQEAEYAGDDGDDGDDGGYDEHAEDVSGEDYVLPETEEAVRYLEAAEAAEGGAAEAQ